MNAAECGCRRRLMLNAAGKLVRRLVRCDAHAALHRADQILEAARREREERVRRAYARYQVGWLPPVVEVE